MAKVGNMTAYLDALSEWPVDNVAAALLRDGEVMETLGETSRVFSVASVTKPVVAYGVMLAVEEGALELDQPAGPEGSTVRHLLAHASGVGFDSREPQKPVGQRRIYSSSGYEWLADLVSEAAGMNFADYLAEGVLAPLGMKNTTLVGSAGHGLDTTVEDLIAFAAEVMNPQLLHPSTVAEMLTPQFADLDGIVPGYGMHKPCPWGLGFELKGDKGVAGGKPHWTGAEMPAATAGHFGMSGTYLWIVPEEKLAMVALTDHDFGAWAKPLWAETNARVWGALV